MKKLLVIILQAYQVLISPILKQVFGEVCRFNPTCSEYTKQQVLKYGIIKGVRLGLGQLLSCHPWAKK